MTATTLGIDVSKNTLDVNIILAGKPVSKQCDDTDAGHQALIAWLKHRKAGQLRACMEATGRYSLAIALALHEAGHAGSVVSPAQIRDFTRTRLGRNKTDKADAAPPSASACSKSANPSTRRWPCQLDTPNRIPRFDRNKWFDRHKPPLRPDGIPQQRRAQACSRMAKGHREASLSTTSTTQSSNREGLKTAPTGALPLAQQRGIYSTPTAGMEEFLGNGALARRRISTSPASPDTRKRATPMPIWVGRSRRAPDPISAKIMVCGR